MIGHSRLFRTVADDADAFSKADARLVVVQAERRVIQDQLIAAHAALALLDQERDGLEAVCETLQTKLALSRAAYTRQTLVNFPPELLSKIFLAIRFDSMDVWFNHQNWERRRTPREVCDDWSQLPLRLSAVCQHWRAVALGEGRLWAYIALQASIDSGQNELARKAERIDAYLVRSKNNFLHINITYGGDSEEEEGDVPVGHQVILSTVFTRLCAHADRIQYCDIKARNIFAEVAYSVFKTACPALLAGCFDIAGEEDVDQVTGCFPVAPRLRALQLGGDCIPKLSDHADEIESLTSLNVCSIISDNMKQLAVYLRRWGQSIERLGIEIFEDEVVELGYESGFHLPRLRTLVLYQCLILHRFLATGPPLVAPCLTHLSLTDVVVAEDAEDFFTGIAASVTHLSITVTGDLSILGLLHNVTNLTLGGESVNVSVPDSFVIDDRMFDILCDRSSPVWPRLISIRLDETTSIRPREAPSLLRLASIRGPRGDRDDGAHVQGGTTQLAVLSHLEINCSDAPHWLVKEAARLMRPAT